MGRRPAERTIGYVHVVAERINRRRRKHGAVRFRIVSYTEVPSGKRLHQRDEVVELRPGDSIRSYLKGHSDGFEDEMVYEATLLPPE